MSIFFQGGGFTLAVAICMLFSACERSSEVPQEEVALPVPGQTLTEAKKGFETQLTREESEGYPSPEPPEGIFDLVQYDGPLGKMDAYIGTDPGDGQKHPAIIWLVGGFGNSISDGAWNPGERSNDQSASAFRKAGIVTMFPSLRGGNESPGFKEGLFGEADDVIAAAKLLATLDYVDADRIYLGGHSVGGTLALLVAESSGQFRATFALGPVDRVSNYGEDNAPFNVYAAKEDSLRAPIDWLHGITRPTFVFEGEDGNSGSVRAIGRRSKNPLVKTFVIPDSNHFSIIRPLSELIAGKILTDQTGSKSQITMTLDELSACTSKVLAPPRPPFPGGSPLSEFAEFECAIYYLPKPESDPVAVLKELVAKHPASLNWIDSLEDESGKPQVSAILNEDVTENYSPPDLESLRYFAKGLNKEQSEKLQASEQALIVRFRYPAAEALPVLQAANRLIADLAEQTGGLPWDEETRQVFAVDAWRKSRNDSWSGGLPLVSAQTAVHAYRDGEYVRAISLGMRKFGAPDVVIEQFATSGNRDIGNLLNHFCQAVVEGAEFEANGFFDLRLKDIRHDKMRQSTEESLEKNATGIARLAIKRAAWDLGDPMNALMEISFERAKGIDLFAQHHAVTAGFFGATDEVTPVASDDEAIEAASERARARLPELRKVFQAGFESSEHLLLKAPFKTADDSIEWMWVEVSHWEGKVIRGLLQNTPHNVPNLQSGQEVTIDQDEVFDYIFQRQDGGREGNETGKLIEQMRK